MYRNCTVKRLDGSMTGPWGCPTFPLMRIPLVRGTATEDMAPMPSKIVGIGLDDRVHAAERGMGLPEQSLVAIARP